MFGPWTKVDGPGAREAAALLARLDADAAAAARARNRRGAAGAQDLDPHRTDANQAPDRRPPALGGSGEDAGERGNDVARHEPGLVQDRRSREPVGRRAAAAAVTGVEPLREKRRRSPGQHVAGSAVASDGGPVSQTTGPPSGACTIVSAPFSSTTAPSARQPPARPRADGRRPTRSRGRAGARALPRGGQHRRMRRGPAGGRTAHRHRRRPEPRVGPGGSAPLRSPLERAPRPGPIATAPARSAAACRTTPTSSST